MVGRVGIRAVLGGCRRFVVIESGGSIIAMVPGVCRDHPIP